MICRQNGVNGYPTIKVYLDGEEALYDGGRSFEEMEYYVEEFLALHCDITRPSSCDAKSQTYLKKWKNKPDSDVLGEVLRLEKLMERHITYELKRWMKDRISILKQINPEAALMSQEY
jgi:protein disulfide-isomerase A6